MEATADSKQRRHEDPDRLLELTRAVALEVHPEAALDEDLGLDSSLDADFGLESLARAELLRRIEAEFGVEIPEVLLSSAGTPRDLLFGITSARHHPTGVPAAPLRVVAEIGGWRRAESLLQVLQLHLDKRADQVHIRLLGDDGEDDITYRDLDIGARRIAAGILDLGIRRGNTVALMLPTSTDYFMSFFGVLAAGCIPVPIYPPARAAQLEDHLRRHARILSNARAELLITTKETERAAHLLEKQVPSIRAVAAPAMLAAHGELPSFATCAAGDIAFLQYTSGTTGNPKGVVLTHANVLANLRAVGSVIALEPDDVVVSWLPLYHDMGLIGTWLGSFYFALPLISMSPLRFLARPSRWLRAIEQYRGTLSAAPNFAYEICATKIPDDEIAGLNLSSWRLAMNGAEPVSAETIRRFTERFGPYGFRSDAMFPVYGLAECTIALTFPPLARAPLVDAVDRERFVTEGIAVPSAAPDALHFVGCGEPIPQHEIRVVDAGDAEVPDRREGRVQFRGPSATRGYFDNDLETRRVMHGTWLDSGDVGYTVGRELFITGREKDVIIRAGRHIHPDELEQAIGNVDGIRRGCVAVFGTQDPVAQTERVVVVAETREQNRDRRARIEASVRATAVDLCGVAPDQILLAAPHSILKTSSGKIRRQATRATFESGRVREPAPLWLQWVRVQKTSLRPGVVRAWRRTREIAYASYALTAAVFAAPLLWLSVALCPGLQRRRTVMKLAARTFLRILRIPVEVHGIERIRGRAVIAANHASYLDGIVLAAILPADVCFVVKHELVRRFYSRIFFSRVGASFVERFAPRRGLEDAARLADLAQSASLVIFPEATFSRSPGLLPFRMGAFLTAAQSNTPLIPVTLCGTRSILRGDDWFPRRGRVEVVIGDPIQPSGTHWSAAIDLQKKVRAEILANCGEPDLERVRRGVAPLIAPG